MDPLVFASKSLTIFNKPPGKNKQTNPVPLATNTAVYGSK